MPVLVTASACSGSLHAGQRFAKPGLSGFSSNSSEQTAHTLIGNAISAQRRKFVRPARKLTGEGARLSTIYNWLILARNSLFDPAFASRSISNSMASTADKGFGTLR